MFRPTPERLSTVEGREEMALVRGREDPCQGLLIVAETQGRQFCVLVDEVAGKQEVVIKSLGESLRNIAGIAGGAILGDGRVGLILDMDAVFRGSPSE